MPHKTQFENCLQFGLKLSEKKQIHFLTVVLLRGLSVPAGASLREPGSSIL